MSDGQEPSEGVVPNTAMMFAYISEKRTVIEEEEAEAVVVVKEEAQQEIQQEDHSAYKDNHEEEEEERIPTTTTNVEETNENGFHDVVPASLAEVSGREETHTVHLVEGDFFPEDSPSRVELRNADERGDNIAKGLPQKQQQEKQDDEEKKEQEEQEQEQEEGSMGEREKTSQYRHSVREKAVGKGKKGSDVCPSWYTITRSSVKRVRWADEVAVSAPLVQHATTFFLPLGDQTQEQQQQQQQQQQQSMLYGEIDKMLQTLSPPPVLREERNSDGTTYLSCRAQRPAKRFVMWKRGVAASGHNADDPPFKLQPLGSRPATHNTTLLAALHPPYRAENVGTTVQMRVATISQDAKKGEALCDGGLQMPMVRSSQLLNVPLCIPF
ncbi:hypothetical protein LSM04_001124 [Trypanosoma melophagium]|uniref:uncharacterized protein n=1 Tax=Trypanosoma melophagium TaxID=715481 RepID=UPI00351A9495|nr:hypothetical protein LSM04_001124 [Trypanosoma melophagium]